MSYEVSVVANYHKGEAFPFQLLIFLFTHNYLNTLPFLLFSAALIATVNQTATSVRADVQDSATTKSVSSADNATLTGDVVTLSPYDTTKLNDFFIGGTTADTYPTYEANGTPTGDGFGGGDDETHATHQIDNILINADNENVYYGINGLSHADSDRLYVQYDSTAMRLNGSTDPVTVTLNFHDSVTGKIIQTRTIKSGIGATDRLYSYLSRQANNQSLFT